MAPLAANLRGQLAELLCELQDLGREMSAAARRAPITRDEAEDYRHRIDDLNQRIHFVRHELTKTSDPG
jgi:hypothetical protein